MDAKRIEELRQLAAGHPKSQWLDECLDEIERLNDMIHTYHEERQELRGLIQQPMPKVEGTAIAEFGPKFPLIESAKMLVAKIEALEKEVKDHAEWARRVATDPEFAPALELVRRLTVAEEEVERLKALLPDDADNICAACEYHGKKALKQAKEDEHEGGTGNQG